MAMGKEKSEGAGRGRLWTSSLLLLLLLFTIFFIYWTNGFELNFGDSGGVSTWTPTAFYSWMRRGGPKRYCETPGGGLLGHGEGAQEDWYDEEEYRQIEERNSAAPTPHTSQVHAEHLEELKDNKGEYRHMLLGDSLVGRWMTTAKENWDTYLAPKKVFNAGVDAERVENVLYRLRNGLLRNSSAEKEDESGGFCPTVLGLLVGTNHLPENTAEEIFQAILLVPREIHRWCPETFVEVLSIPPLIHQENRWITTEMEVATLLTKYYGPRGRSRTHFHNFQPLLWSENGTVDASLYMKDGVHFSKKGYETIAPYFSSLFNVEECDA